MKIYFHSLAPVKKEIGALRKLISKISDKKQPVQSIQDLVANYYGWEHFNQMSHAHDKMKAIPNLDLLDHEKLEEYDISFINMISPFMRSRLEVRKRRLLNDYLVRRDFSEYVCEKVNEEAFNKKSLIDKFLYKNDTPTIKSLFEIPATSWKTHSCIFGNDPERLAYVYGGIPLANAFKVGGFMILRESVAHLIINEIEESMNEYPKTKLKYFYAAPSIHFRKERLEGLLNFNPFQTESISTLTLMFNSMMHSEFDSYHGEDMWKGRAMHFLETFFRMMRKVKNNQKGAFTIKEFRKLLALDNLMAFMKEHGGRGVFPDLYQFLLHLPAFEEEKFLSGEPMNPKVYENYGYIIMQFSAILSDMEDCLIPSDNTIDLEDALKSDDIVIAIIPDELHSDHYASMCISAFRKTLVSQLGVPLDQSKQDIIHTLSTLPKDTFKPVVLDHFSSYRGVQGIGVIAAQAKSLGCGFYFGISDPIPDKRNHEEDFASVLANTMHYLFTECREDVYNIFDDLVRLEDYRTFEQKLDDNYEITQHNYNKDALFKELGKGNILYYGKRFSHTNPKHPVKIIPVSK